MSTIRFSNQFTTNAVAAGTTFNSNTTYIIDGDYTLVSGSYMFDNCILIFEGGSLYGSSSTTPSLILNNCTIEGSGHIFRGSINLGPYGNYASRLLNKEIKAEWFGALPYQSADVTSFINKAIKACYATDVRTLSFASGTFKVCLSSSILIGQATSEQSVENTHRWEIRIKGIVKYPGRGYMNRLGKHFHKTSTGILISDGVEMSDYEAALEANGWSITKSGNIIKLPYVLLGMLSAYVEIYDMRNGFFLFFEASRPSLTSTFFTISVQCSMQMQAVSNNQYGTVLIAAAFSEAEDIKVWVKKLS